jgi:hypothetical protein
MRDFKIGFREANPAWEAGAPCSRRSFSESTVCLTVHQTFDKETAAPRGLCRISMAKKAPKAEAVEKLWKRRLFDRMLVEDQTIERYERIAALTIFIFFIQILHPLLKAAFVTL